MRFFSGGPPLLSELEFWLCCLMISDVFPFSASRGLVQYGRGLVCAHSAAVSDGFGVRLCVVRVFMASDF